MGRRRYSGSERPPELGARSATVIQPGLIELVHSRRSCGSRRTFTSFRIGRGVWMVVVKGATHGQATLFREAPTVLIRDRSRVPSRVHWAQNSIQPCRVIAFRRRAFSVLSYLAQRLPFTPI